MTDELENRLDDLLEDMKSAQAEATDADASEDVVESVSLNLEALNLKDLSAWDRSELEAARAYLDTVDNEDELGDLSDCPEWCQFCAARYFDSVLNPDLNDVRTVSIFQPRTDYERKARRKIAAARADLWDRQDWLRGRGKTDELRQEFGDVAGVPDWIKEAAIRELQQQIFNLSTAQRRNPAERNPL